MPCPHYLVTSLLHDADQLSLLAAVIAETLRHPYVWDQPQLCVRITSAGVDTDRFGWGVHRVMTLFDLVIQIGFPLAGIASFANSVRVAMAGSSPIGAKIG